MYLGFKEPTVGECAIQMIHVRKDYDNKIQVNIL